MEPWVLIPVVAIVMVGLQGIVRTVRGLPDRRYVHRRRGRGLVVGGLLTGDGEDSGGPDEQVRAELDALRQRVTELEERQDFTDRMLTRGRDAEAGGSY